MRTSRTYKLQLSGQGIDQFLACHCRVARLAKEFIPYGMTLYVAMSLLDASDPADIAAELNPQCAMPSVVPRTASWERRHTLPILLSRLARALLIVAIVVDP
ncbi:hypothetical protein ACFSHP_26160 [Novosphingobium panipatense]